MSTVLSNSDSILVAIPMVGILIACFFRLDEMFGKPKIKKKIVQQRRQMSGWDEHGVPVCTDPDGSSPAQVIQRPAPSKAKIRK